MLRKCTKCGVVLPATTEYFIAAQQGRLRGECKPCAAMFRAAYYQQHKATANQRTREWIAKHPERRKAIVKKYRDANRDACNARVKAHYEKDIDRSRRLARAKTNAWAERHINHAREIRRAAVKKRKALKRGAKEATLTRQQWEQIKIMYNHRCAYCGETRTLTQDHVIPLSHGGHHTSRNVVPACVTCNCSKKSGPPPIPMLTLKFLPVE